MDCNDLQELLAAFALGALPPDQEAAVRAHLDDCDAHAGVIQLRAAAIDLAASVPERDPPARLRARLLAALADDPAAAPAPPAAPRSPLPFARWGLNLKTLAAGLALLVVGLVAWNVILQVDDDSPGFPAGVVREFTAQPGAVGQGTVETAAGLALLSFQNLAAPGPDRVYQIWALGPPTPVSLGLLPVDSDGSARLELALPNTPQLISGLALTLEAAPGVVQPTTDPLYLVDL